MDDKISREPGRELPQMPALARDIENRLAAIRWGNRGPCYSLVRALAVERQQVVADQGESIDGRLGFGAIMGAVPIHVCIFNVYSFRDREDAASDE